MAIYGNHLAHSFGTFAVPCFREYRDRLLAAALGGYADIGERAEQVANQAFEEMGSVAAGGEDSHADLGDIAEAAGERGQLYYEMMTGMRQATINLHTAGLFHLLEQQLGNLIHQVRHSEHPSRLGVPPRSNLHAYANWIRDEMGLDLRSLLQWAAVEELGLVANATKHAEGQSEGQLRGLRPDLFVHPLVADMRPPGQQSFFFEPLRLPLAGDGLYVTEAVFGEYATAVFEFVRAILAHLRENWRTLYPLSHSSTD